MNSPIYIVDLEAILQEPELFLPSRSLYSLMALVNGTNHKTSIDIWDHLNSFHNWLEFEYMHINSSQTECKLVLNISLDPYHAFEQFFSLLIENGETEIIPLLDEIKKAPYDYLPQRSIHALYAFFTGLDLVYQEEAEPINLNRFEIWLQERFDSSYHSWDKILLRHAHDEYIALQYFKEFYLEYISEAYHVSDTTPLGRNAT